MTSALCWLLLAHLPSGLDSEIIYVDVIELHTALEHDRIEMRAWYWSPQRRTWETQRVTGNLRSIGWKRVTWAVHYPGRTNINRAGAYYEWSNGQIRVRARSVVKTRSRLPPKEQKQRWDWLWRPDPPA